MKPTLVLSALAKGIAARVKGFAPGAPDLETKLREFGFAEGAEVELLGRGPLGGTPLSVRLNRTVVALRAREADAVEVAVET